MGVPVIAADNRGTREYMLDGVNGFIFDPDNVDELVECIYKFIALDDESKQRMRDNCRPTVLRFDHEKTNKIMREIYSNLSEQ